MFDWRFSSLVTLFEAAPKDKKQKEDKSSPIGQAVLDMWPLLKSNLSSAFSSRAEKTHYRSFITGETQVSVTIPIFATTGSFLEAQVEQHQVRSTDTSLVQANEASILTLEIRVIDSFYSSVDLAISDCEYQYWTTTGLHSRPTTYQCRLCHLGRFIFSTRSMVTGWLFVHLHSHRTDPAQWRCKFDDQRDRICSAPIQFQ